MEKCSGFIKLIESLFNLKANSMKRLNIFFIVPILLISILSCTTKKTEAPINSSSKQEMVDRETLKMFPEVKDGLSRKAIIVAPLENESNYKVEIYLGKELMVDCNVHRLSGNLEEKTLSGWGYSYYTFAGSADILSTRRACPEGELTKEFISSKGIMCSYNSSLPIVVYIPEGLELRYHIWSRGDQQKKADSF